MKPSKFNNEFLKALQFQEKLNQDKDTAMFLVHVFSNNFILNHSLNKINFNTANTNR